jgi:hypothetical protein
VPEIREGGPWVRNPPAVDRRSSLPNLHVSKIDAGEIAGFWDTLR